MPSRKANGPIRKTRRIYRYKLPEGLGDAFQHKISPQQLRAGFVEQTTSHAVTHVAKAPGPCKKIFWTILSLASLVALIVHITYLTIQFAKFETVTDIQEEELPNITFPAVTICNQNIVPKDKYYDFNSPFLVVGLPPENQTFDQGAKEIDLDEKILYDMSYLEDERKEELGQDINETILDCVFNDIPCYPKDFFKYFDPVNGNCFTYNSELKMPSGDPLNTVRRSGYKYGLKVELNAQLYNFLPLKTSKPAGFKVLIHGRNVMPFPDELGMNIAPNTQVDVSVKEVNVKRAGGLYGTCSDGNMEGVQNVYKLIISDISYSKEACMKTCLQRQIIKDCGCYATKIPYDPIMFTNGDEFINPCPPAFSVDDKNDISCVTAVEYDLADGIFRCEECSVPCREVSYEQTATAVKWPTEEYLWNTNLDSNNSIYWPILDSGYDGSTSKEEAVSQNVVKLQVYFSAMTRKNITEKPSIEFVEFIADLGGVFGLWIGWSVLTLFEFTELAADFFAYYVLRTKLRRVNPARLNTESKSSTRLEANV